jgi:putative ABC transport system permease protein
VYAEQRLLGALNLKPGDTLPVGNLTLRIAGEIVREPDGGELFALAPRLLMTLQDARASGLLGPGSRARNRLMTAGDDAAISTFSTFLKAHKPDGAELITVQQSQQNLRSAFERGEAFLRLAALLAALLSGIAVALAAGRYARRKTDEVALLRCLGATAGEVLAATGFTLVLLALPACLLGAVLGLGFQELVFAFARDLLPGAVAKTPLMPTIAAFAIGLAVLFGFALPPLLRLREVPPVRVFQRAIGARVRRFDALYLLPVVLGAGLIWFESDSLALAGVLSASLAGVGLFALVLGVVSIRLLSRVLRRMPGALRFGAANRRRRGLSLLQITALALALTALDLLAVVGPSLLGAWRAELPADTPNYFLVNIQPEQTTASRRDCRAARGQRQHDAAGRRQTRRDQRQGAARRDYQDRRAAAGSMARRGCRGARTAADESREGRALVRRKPTSRKSRSTKCGSRCFISNRRYADPAHRRARRRCARDQRARRALGFVPREFLPAARSGQAQGLAYSDVASFHLGAVSAEALAGLTRDHPNCP